MACQPLADDGDRHGISSGPEHPFSQDPVLGAETAANQLTIRLRTLAGTLQPRAASATTPDRALAMKAGQLVRDIAVHVRKESGR